MSVTIKTDRCPGGFETAGTSGPGQAAQLTPAPSALAGRSTGVRVMSQIPQSQNEPFVLPAMPSTGDIAGVIDWVTTASLKFWTAEPPYAGLREIRTHAICLIDRAIEEWADMLRSKSGAERDAIWNAAAELQSLRALFNERKPLRLDETGPLYPLRPENAAVVEGIIQKLFDRCDETAIAKGVRIGLMATRDNGPKGKPADPVACSPAEADGELAKLLELPFPEAIRVLRERVAELRKTTVRRTAEAQPEPADPMEIGPATWKRLAFYLEAESPKTARRRLEGPTSRARQRFGYRAQTWMRVSR